MNPEDGGSDLRRSLDSNLTFDAAMTGHPQCHCDKRKFRSHRKENVEIKIPGGNTRNCNGKLFVIVLTQLHR
jgi:hypothetical protein